MGLAAFFTGNANANTDAFSNCRKLTVAIERLACYDQISPPQIEAKIESKNEPRVGPPPSRSIVVPVNTASQFGLSATTPAAKIDKITSTISGRFSSWQPNSKIALANGQVWQVIDDSRGVCECDNPKVTVSRASFGTFFLEIDGKGNAPRVKRIQ